jgi:hypothetical protein
MTPDVNASGATTVELNHLIRFPMRVIRVVLTVGQPLPVYPDQRTSSDRRGWSGSCQSATSEVGYSITSSASANTLAGNSSPSDFAVLRFKTISNLVG